jgi:hypothetical protein
MNPELDERTCAEYLVWLPASLGKRVDSAKYTTCFHLNSIISDCRKGLGLDGRGPVLAPSNDLTKRRHLPLWHGRKTLFKGVGLEASRPSRTSNSFSRKVESRGDVT